MKNGDLVLIKDPHWAAGLTALFVDDQSDYCLVSIEYEGGLKNIKVPCDQLELKKEKDNF